MIIEDEQAVLSKIIQKISQQKQTSVQHALKITTICSQ